jgi:DNA-directed RNA polymerase subunit beta'
LKESRGEVLNQKRSTTVRTSLSVMVFSVKEFWTSKDFECACGKYKRIRYKGIICDRCGVEVTEKKVRRDRVGHINLVVPIAHIWYFRSL